jgi:drug/metabolite transporter (DMT)-like permease
VSAALVAGLGLAVLAAAALNASYLLQHAGAADAPPVSVRRPLRTARGLLDSRLWVFGLVLGLTGWGLHVGALSLAPLSLVQSFAAAGLAMAAIAAVRFLGERLGRRELLGIAVLVVALATLALGARESSGNAPVAAMAAFLGLSAAAAGGLVLLGGAAHRPQVLGAAGGILYGAADAATKAATAVLGHSGVVAALPVIGVIALLSAGAFFCFQRGLQIGRALPVIALMSAATNLVAILGGVVVFGDPVGATAALAAAHVVAFLLVGVGCWLLAPAQARMMAAGDEAGHAPSVAPVRAAQGTREQVAAG